jgi:hypothetical protein
MTYDAAMPRTPSAYSVGSVSPVVAAAPVVAAIPTRGVTGASTRIASFRIIPASEVICRPFWRSAVVYLL